MAQEESDGMFRTANMALAAFLLLRNIEAAEVQWKDGTCYWIFEGSSELNELVTSFSGGQARIDPRAYSYKLTQMRKDMRSLPS